MVCQRSRKDGNMFSNDLDTQRLLTREHTERLAQEARNEWLRAISARRSRHAVDGDAFWRFRRRWYWRHVAGRLRQRSVRRRLDSVLRPAGRLADFCLPPTAHAD